jgi:hypothetical protein
LNLAQPEAGMAFPIRTVFLSGGLAAIIAGALVAPSLFPAAFAAEPQKHLLDAASEFFPKPFDPSTLRKFDISVDDSVSTKVQRSDTVQKIGFGKRTIVSIVTTPSGTYSSDAIASPYVRYPGIDVSLDEHCDCSPPHSTFGVATSPYGTRIWSYVNSGSFTFITSTFTPAKRGRT